MARWGLEYGVDIPAPLIMVPPGGSPGALSPGLKATAQLLELSLGWQGETESLASEDPGVWDKGEIGK